MSVHVVVGAGAVGTTLAQLLATQGHEVRLLSRRGAGPDVAGIERRAIDATDAAALADATRGADALHDCANPPYHRWASDWPPLAAAALHAAERSGAVLVTVSNLYGYGPVRGPISEDLPLAATGTKGRVRARMWLDALDAHEAGRVRAVEVRASDFFGPHVHQAMLGDRAMTRLVAGRPVPLLGDPDARHSVSYLPDVAALMAIVAADPRAWGRAWHVPSPPAITQRETVRVLGGAAGHAEVRVQVAPKVLLRLAGLVVPTVRELRETLHQFEHAWVLDSSRAEQTFGLSATPLPEAAAATVAWWRGRAGAPVAA